MAPKWYRLFVTIIWLTIATSRQASVHAQEVVGSIGTTIDPNLEYDDANNDDEFYLNVLAPATANGSIFSVRTCYTLQEDDSQAEIAFYRPQGNSFDLQFAFSVRLNDTSGAASRTLACQEIPTPTPVEVVEGDVIGVCSGYSSATLGRINFVTEHNANPEVTLLTGESPDVSCGEGTVPSIISTNQLQLRRDLTLLIDADIKNATDSEAPTVATSTSYPGLSTPQSQDNSLTRLEIIIITVGAVVTATLIGCCMLLCAVLVTVKKSRRKLRYRFKDVAEYQHNEDHAISFPSICYHQDIEQTPPPAPNDPPVINIVTPSYATIAPLDNSEHIVYEDSFEYTGEDGLWSQNNWTSEYGDKETDHLQQEGHDSHSHSVMLTHNQAYGCAGAAGDGDGGADETR